MLNKRPKSNVDEILLKNELPVKTGITELPNIVEQSNPAHRNNKLKQAQSHSTADYPQGPLVLSPNAAA